MTTLTFEDILRTIAVQNDMRYWEENTVVDNFGRKGIIFRMEGKELRIKDTCMFNDLTPNHILAQQIRFRILSMIMTAGLKQLTQSCKEFYEGGIPKLDTPILTDEDVKDLND
jgi:hypothetical protein